MAESTITTRIEGNILTIECNGGKIVVNPAEFARNIVDAAVLHGFKQKIIDAAALSRDEETGRPATPAQKLAAMEDVVAQLREGDWNRRATGDGTSGSGLLVVALMRLTGKDRDAVEATVAGWSKEQQAAMRASAQVAPVIATIKAERAAKAGQKAAPVDVSGLLASILPADAPAQPSAEPAKPVRKAKQPA
jgi:hypothetical protein